MLNITVTDILSGNFTFGDVHPETCSDIDLRNLKANALAAAAIQDRMDRGQVGLDKERSSASKAVSTLTIELIKDLVGDTLENGMNLVMNVTAFAKAVIEAGL